MKKILTAVICIFVVFLFVSCNDESILDSVYNATETSDVIVLDWIDDTHYLCNTGIFTVGSEESLLDNKGIRNASYTSGSDWYVLKTNGDLYTGTLSSDKIKLGTSPILQDVKALTQSGFYTTANKVYKNSATFDVSGIETVIESNGYLLVKDSSKIYVLDENCSLQFSLSFSDAVYGFVATGTKFYALTYSKIYQISSDTSAEKCSYDPLVQPYIQAFASGEKIVYQTETGFSYTNDAVSEAEEGSCLSILSGVENVVEVYKKSTGSFIVATATNGVYEISSLTATPSKVNL